MTCDKCGAELAVGQWPWCPHEDARNFGEEPMQPYFDEMITPEGAYLTTRAERRRIMYANKQEYHDVSKKKRGRVYVCLGGK